LPSYQKLSTWCGPASVQTALEAIGRGIDQEALARLCNATEDGCDEFDLMQAIRLCFTKYGEIAVDSPQEAMRQLQARLILGQPVIVCCEDYEHWCCAIGLIGDKVILVDPSNEHENKDRNGLWFLSADEMVDKWEASEEVTEGDPAFYGIWLSEDGE